jgi:iron complex transport system substrate-binding protein
MKKQDNNNNSSRLISLAASITETLFTLGLGDRVVGVTDTCDYPSEVLDLQNIGCWFEPNLEMLIHLKPDLVIGLETAHRNLEAPLNKVGIELKLINPTTVDQAIGTIAELGSLLGAADAGTIVDGLNTRLEILDNLVSEIDRYDRLTTCRILEFDAGEVYVAGPLSFQYDIITRAGGINVTSALVEAYPRIHLEQLVELDPSFIFYCGYNLEYLEKMMENPVWRSMRVVETGRIHRFPCELTCRFGPRIVDMTELLHQTLYS